MWKKIVALVMKNAKRNTVTETIRPLRPVEQYVQLTLPLD